MYRVVSITASLVSDYKYVVTLIVSSDATYWLENSTQVIETAPDLLVRVQNKEVIGMGY